MFRHWYWALSEEREAEAGWGSLGGSAGLFVENDWGPRAGDAWLIISVRLSVSLQGRGDRRERERKRASKKEKCNGKREIDREKTYERERKCLDVWFKWIWKASSKILPPETDRGNCSPLAGKSRGPGSSQRNTGTIKRARHRNAGCALLPEWLYTYRRDSSVDQGSTVTKIEYNGLGDIKWCWIVFASP